MEQINPMLASTGSIKDLKRKDLIFEPKLDGYRALLYKEDNKISLLSRNGLNLMKKFSGLNLSNNILAKNAVIDGEIVTFDKSGNPSFQLLQKKNDSHDVVYIVFDVLSLNKTDLTNKTLIERKKILDKLIKDNKNIQKIVYTVDGKKLWGLIKKRKLEGVIGKIKKSNYIQKRSNNWVKIKVTNTIDAIVLGFKSKKRKISSLLLGLYYNKKIINIGFVGTGFNEESLKEFDNLFKNNILNKEKNITYIKPIFVCEVKYSEVTIDKKLRAPVFIRLRSDKKPEECRIDTIDN